jgi:hypothetical protein
MELQTRVEALEGHVHELLGQIDGLLAIVEAVVMTSTPESRSGVLAAALERRQELLQSLPIDDVALDRRWQGRETIAAAGHAMLLRASLPDMDLESLLRGRPPGTR